MNLAVFAGLCIGLVREGLPPGGGWAALALVSGVGGAMAVVHTRLHPAGAAARAAISTGRVTHRSLRGKPGASVLEKLASRDYTYLLLVLALAGHLEWFLYAAAGGAWLFTLGVVAYALVSRPRRSGQAPR